MTLAHNPGFSRVGTEPELNDVLRTCWHRHPAQQEPDWERLFEGVDEALASDAEVKSVLIGPLSFLWSGKAEGQDLDTLDLLERLLPIYGDIFGRLAARGLEWIQIDEPILSLDLPQDWKNAFERAYHILQYSPLKKLVATCANGFEDNLGMVALLPVAGLHIERLQAPEQLARVLDRLPTYKILSLGAFDNCAAWQASAPTWPQAQARFGDNLWLAASSKAAA